MIAWIIEDGKAHKATLHEAAQADRESNFIWFHLDGQDPESLGWLSRRTDIPEVARKAMAAEETRPRTEPMAQGALINLRGLGDTPEDDPDALVSIRLWAERGRVISLALRDPRALTALCESVAAGKVRDPGDLIAALATHITDALDPEVAELGDTLDSCELRMEDRSVYATRRIVTKARAHAINYRRFVAPQRQALERLATLDADWLEEEDRAHLREAADRCARMTEELEAVRERAALMHEEFTDLRAEQLDARSLVIAVVAFVFLPLTFLTGLFGMNVPLPLPDKVSSFWWVLAGSGAITAIILGWFFWRWMRRGDGP